MNEILDFLERALVFRRLAFLIGLWITVDMWAKIGAKLVETNDPAMVGALAAAMAPMSLLSGGLLKVYSDHRKAHD